MASYRFCRPDDIPLLVGALERCYRVHFPEDDPFTVAGFRDEMKRLDVWPSNSMVAMLGEEPIAVMIGTKREDEVLVRRIGVHPQHLRLGHGLHLLTSLSHKLAVLGPPRLAVELPLELPGVEDFFRAAGYQPQGRFSDWIRSSGSPAPEVPEGLVIPVSVDDLVDDPLLELARPLPWSRTRASVLANRESFRGIALGTPVGLEACLLYRDSRDHTDVFVASCRQADRTSMLMGLLLAHLIDQASRPLRLPKLAAGELPVSLLESLGFEPGREYRRYSALASPP